MDILTDILREAGLQRRILDQRLLAADNPLRFPCERSIGLHIVSKGSVYVHAPGLPEPLHLKAGDIALMARGCDHVLSAGATFRPDQVVSVLAVGSQQKKADLALDTANRVISGAYQFWNMPVHPFFAEMPDWFVLKAEALPRLGPLSLTVALIDGEVNREALGADTIMDGLLDVVLTYLLREMVDQIGKKGSNWSHAIADLPVRKAIGLMHADCASAWSLEELASRVGLSRTSFAERFRLAMGDTPLSYLRTIRVQKAMKILSDRDDTLEQVAQAVGYQDAFGFSKVFKRIAGMAPSAFRRGTRNDIASPWRLKAS
jgi:AraC-like DNA-binding protein